MTATPEPTGGSTPAQPKAPTDLPAVKAATPARPARRSSAPLVLLGLLALLVAVGSAAVAVYALDQARQAKSQANEARSIADRAGTPTPTVVAPKTTAPAVTPTVSTSRGPAFIAELTRAELKIPAAPSPCASVFVDIDTMTTGTLAGHEFYLSACVGPLSLHVDRTSGAVTTANNPTPQACAAQITTESSGVELILPVVNGLTFCLVTNRTDAAQQGIPQRITIIEVKGVGADNSVTTLVGTYRVPGTP